jgi:hypothetical protein
MQMMPSYSPLKPNDPDSLNNFRDCLDHIKCWMLSQIDCQQLVDCYLHLRLHLGHLADAFIQSDLQ